ncbi:MAG: 2-isopropylmalate synthase [Armatimonadetes bacterium]|nr:2-isopropylmalate synthase [Armatimonadota bacterium]
MLQPGGPQREERALIYDWNTVGRAPRRPRGPVELDDETLRDGLQSPSVLHPPVERRKELLHLMDALGINGANIGYPGAGRRALDDVAELAAEIGRSRLRVQPNCAGRTVPGDIDPIAEVQQRSGVSMEAAIFMGSSPIRQYAEGWDLDFLLRTTEEAVTLALRHGLRVMYVTEDTTRARPRDLERLYTTAIECGASRVCVADTVGHATPWGVRNVMTFVRRVVARTGRAVKVDWHGHRDRGLDLINALAAVEAGANRVHACALGIGERVGNTPMDLLLVNLKLLGWIDRDLRALPAYCRVASEATGMPILCNYPVIGKDAFETSTGVHAAAIVKAFAKGHHWLANRVYSGVPAEEVGREQVLTVGPMSGQSNVTWCLRRLGVEPTPEVVDRVLAAAKACNRVLREDEIVALLHMQAVAER